MVQSVILLSAIAFFAFFTRGATGAAGAIVFNALFLAATVLGWTGDLTLHDGLYWMALTNAGASLMMAVKIRPRFREEPISLLYLAGTVPVSAVFSIVLTRVDSRQLVLPMAIVVILAGVFIVARPRLEPASDRTLKRLALPTGLAAGVIAGLFGMGGPIGLLLFARSTNDPTVFRDRLTIVTSTQALARVVVLALAGVFTAERLGMAALTVPATALGLATGMYVHRFVRSAPMKMVLGGLVVLAGVVALFR